MLHFSFNSKKCFHNIIITDIGVLYYDQCCFFEGMLLGKTFFTQLLGNCDNMFLLYSKLLIKNKILIIFEYDHCDILNE
jgi:hypothetical protein